MTPARRIGIAALAMAMLWLPLASLVFMVGVDAHAGTRLVRHFVWPGWQWLTYLPQAGPNRTVRLWIVVSAAVATVPLLACLIAMARAMLRRDRPLHGAARWATTADLKKKDSGFRLTWRVPEAGFLLGRLGRFGRYVSLDQGNHISARAPSGSGKGVSIAIPNAMLCGGSLLCFSVKRDIWEAAAAERLRRGDKVFLFDPGSPEWRTHRWNPLGKVPRHGVGVFNACQRIMHRVVPESRSSNPFFDDAARRWVTSLATIVAESPDLPLDMATVKRILSRPDRASFVRGLVHDAQDRGRPLHPAAVDTTLGWLGKADDKEVRSVLETLGTHLSLWDDEVICAATEVSDFDLGAMRSIPTSLFLAIGVSEMARLRPLLRLLLAEFVAENTRYDWGRDPRRRHAVRGRAIFDEFWAAGRVPEMTDAVSFIRSAGWDTAYITQTKAQVEEIQGKAGAENIFANTTEVYFAGADMRTAKEIQDLGGRRTVQEVSRNRPAWMGWAKPDRQTENRQDRGIDLILAQEVRTMDPGHILVSRRNTPLLKLRRVVYHEDRNLSWREGPPPPVPRLKVSLDRGGAPVWDDGPAMPGTPMTISYRV